jgi:hypothetical protein
MLDFTTPEKQEENFPLLLDALAGAAMRYRISIPDTPELTTLRQEFDNLWLHDPIERGGTNALTAESRMLWIAMRKAGMDKVSDCTCDNGGGWYMRYGNGETMFMPFGDTPETLSIEYRMAISALKAEPTR